MEKRFFQWIGFGFVVIALLSICAGLMNGISNNFTADKKGDLATWTAALFAALAFGGTVFIAKSESRRRREDEIVRARLAAARIKQKLAAAAGLAKGVCTKLQTADQVYPPKQLFTDAAEKLHGLVFWTYDDLVALTPLGDGMAYRLAQAQDEIESVMRVLDSAGIAYDRFERDTRRETALDMATLLGTAAKRIELSWYQCRALIPEDPLVRQH